MGFISKRTIRAIWALSFIQKACRLGFVGVILLRLLLPLTFITSSSPIEEKRSRESIDPLRRNRYFRFNQSITPLWFRFTFLFSSFFIYWSSFQSNQNPKTTPSLDHGDETKWEVYCLLRLWWESYVLQRCLSRAACNSVALPTHPFLGRSEPDQEDTDWPRNAPHRRTGKSILQKNSFDSLISMFSENFKRLFKLFYCPYRFMYRFCSWNFSRMFLCFHWRFEFRFTVWSFV